MNLGRRFVRRLFFVPADVVHGRWKPVAGLLSGNGRDGRGRFAGVLVPGWRGGRSTMGLARIQQCVSPDCVSLEPRIPACNPACNVECLIDEAMAKLSGDLR